MWIESRDSSDAQNFIETYSNISTSYNHFSFHGNVITFDVNRMVRMIFALNFRS